MILRSGVIFPAPRSQSIFQKAKSFLLVFVFVGLFLLFYPATKNQFTKPLPLRFAALLPLKPIASAEVADGDFSLLIPKINLNAPILANIDPASSPTYRAALKEGVAHAQGTLFPDGEGTVYLFDHSSDFRRTARFARLNELLTGDRVEVYFQGRRYTYQVEKKEILSRSDLRYYFDRSPVKKLILQTCWPVGTSLKQLVVVATPV